jgi:hypothetical protein
MATPLEHPRDVVEEIRLEVVIPEVIHEASNEEASRQGRVLAIEGPVSEIDAYRRNTI